MEEFQLEPPEVTIYENFGEIPVGYTEQISGHILAGFFNGNSRGITSQISGGFSEESTRNYERHFERISKLITAES